MNVVARKIVEASFLCLLLVLFAGELLAKESATKPEDGVVVDVGGGVQMQFATIPAGSFTMGSPTSEANRCSDESPSHTVSIARPLLMGQTEVTQSQWRAVMGSNPSKSKGDSKPVENVTWQQCKEFCSRLSAKLKKKVRLPSEAEWEYACRAGSPAPRYGQVDAIAWHKGNSGRAMRDVATRQPNAWGLFDMLGSVYEWCEDPWHGSYNDAPSDGSVRAGSGTLRVLRGGSFVNPSGSCRAARRYCGDYANRSYGFRVVLGSSPAQ